MANNQKKAGKKGISPETKALLIDFIGLVVYGFLFGFLSVQTASNPNGIWIVFGISAAYCAAWYYFVDRKTGGLLYTGILLAMLSMVLFHAKG